MSGQSECRYVREKHGTRKEEWSEMRTSALASGSGAGCRGGGGVAHYVGKGS